MLSTSKNKIALARIIPTTDINKMMLYWWYMAQSKINKGVDKMGTSSAIGRLVNSNSVQFVMCNYDGYLDGVGKELIAEYNSPSAVIELISGGEIRSIIPRLEYYEDGEPADAR